MNMYKPKKINEELENCIGGALNDNANEGVDRNGEPDGFEFIMGDDFDDVVKQAIKDIMQSDYINIKFKE